MRNAVCGPVAWRSRQHLSHPTHTNDLQLWVRPRGNAHRDIAPFLEDIHDTIQKQALGVDFRELLQILHVDRRDVHLPEESRRRDRELPTRHRVCAGGHGLGFLDAGHDATAVFGKPRTGIHDAHDAGGAGGARKQPQTEPFVNLASGACDGLAVTG